MNQRDVRQVRQVPPTIPSAFKRSPNDVTMEFETDITCCLSAAALHSFPHSKIFKMHHIGRRGIRIERNVTHTRSKRSTDGACLPKNLRQTRCAASTHIPEIRSKFVDRRKSMKHRTPTLNCARSKASRGPSENLHGFAQTMSSVDGFSVTSPDTATTAQRLKSQPTRLHFNSTAIVLCLSSLKTAHVRYDYQQKQKSFTEIRSRIYDHRFIGSH